MADPPDSDSPPPSAHITEYDRSHFKTYLHLLDADAEDVDWREVLEHIIGRRCGGCRSPAPATRRCA